MDQVTHFLRYVPHVSPENSRSWWCLYVSHTNNLRGWYFENVSQMRSLSNILSIEIRAQNVGQVTNLIYSFFLLCDNNRCKDYPTSDQDAHFIDASILPAISTRWAIAKAICADPDWLSSVLAHRSFSENLIKKGSYRGWVHRLGSNSRPLCGPSWFWLAVARYQVAILHDVNGSETALDADILLDTRAYGISWLAPPFSNLWPNVCLNICSAAWKIFGPFSLPRLDNPTK